MQEKMLTREQVHAARVLFVSNVYDLDLLCSSFVLRLHNFLNTWRGGTEYQCVTTCRNILHTCKDGDTVAVLKYLLLPETQEDLNNVCLLPWCREVACWFERKFRSELDKRQASRDS